MDIIPWKKLLGSIKPDLKILFHDKLNISVTTTIVVPVSSSSFASPLLSKEFQENFLVVLESFFKELSFSTNEDLKNENCIEDSKVDPKEEIDDNLDDGFENLESFEQVDDGDWDSNEDKYLSHETDSATINILKKEKKPKVKKKMGRPKKEKEPTLPICQECGKVFANFPCLKSHMSNVHAEKIHSCDKCEYKSGSAPSLKAHLKNVHGSKEFMCEQCDFATSAKGALLKHLKTHSKRVFQTCPICGKEVIVMSQHMLQHETERGNCDICGKEMKVSQIKKHKKTVHEERRYPCTQCSYKASDSYNLKLHIHKSHLGIKDLPKEQCPHCDIQSTSLAKHMKTYHPEML